MDALHVQLDLFLDGGTYHNATCRYANYVHRSQPLYPSRIDSFSWSQELPDPLLGGLAKRSASVSLSDKDLGRKDAPTLAAIFATENPKGKRARLRAWDPATQQVVFSLNGVISSLGQDYRSLTIESDDPALLQQHIPNERALEYYPSADISFVESKDPPPIQIFGPMPRVTLPLALATQLTFVTTMGGAQSDKYVYADLPHVPNYTVAAGDRLTYDIRLDSAGNRHALDLRCTDATTLRSTAAVDQNNLAVGPASNLDAYAVGKFYRREIDLIAIVGKTISEYMLGCENDTAGTYTARIANAHIVDSLGIKKVTIFDENIETPTIVYQSRNDTATTASSTRNAQWDFGPVKLAASGTQSAVAVYVDGRFRDSSAWTFATENGFRFVRFPARPLDSQGRAAKVQADFDSSEFGRNPAFILKHIWGNAAMLGRTVNDASFTAAAAAYQAIGDYEKVVGGLAERKPALQVLRDLGFRGVRFDRNDNGEVTATVDASAVHPPAIVILGQNDAIKVNNARLETNNTLSNSTAEQTRQFDFLAYRDPGLGVSAQASSLISATRSRSVGGALITRESPYCGAGKMADREADYLFKLLIGLDFDIEVSTSVQIGKHLALGQLVKFYSPKHYFSGTQYMIRRIKFDGKKFTLRLVGYPSDLFTYGAGKVTASRLVDSLVDFSQTSPSAPTSPTYISSDIISGTDGGKLSIEKFRVTLPSVNCTELHAFVFRSGTGQANPFVTVHKKDITLGTTNDIEVAVPPGTFYDIQFHAYAGDNKAEFRYSLPALITGRVASGDTVGPGNVIGLQLSDSPPRGLRAKWNAPSDLDVRQYRLQLYLDAGLILFFRELTVDATETVIGDLEPGQSYWIIVRAEDRSNNPGNWSGAVGITITRLATNDYGLNSITNDRIFSFSADKITAGLFTVNPAGSGATGIQMQNSSEIRFRGFGSSPSRIVFEDGAGVKRAEITSSVADLQIVPDGAGTTYSLSLGTAGKPWEFVDVIAQYDTLIRGGRDVKIEAPTGGIVLVDGKLALSPIFTLSSPLPFSSFLIKGYAVVHDDSGAAYGFMPIILPP